MTVRGFKFTNDIAATLKNWVNGLNRMKVYTDSVRNAFKWGSTDITYVPNGGMTFTIGSEASEMRYIKLFNICFVYGESSGTTGGTASADLCILLPFPLAEGRNSRVPFHCYVKDSSTVAGFAFLDGTAARKDVLCIRRYDSATWGLGSSRNFRFAGFYEVD